MTHVNEPAHPGKIVFIDGITQEITKELSASAVPFGIRFVETDAGLVPVVKIVNITTDKQQTIRQYGPDGQLLRSTVQVANK
jgi:hypothetical protein